MIEEVLFLIWAMIKLGVGLVILLFIADVVKELLIDFFTNKKPEN